MWRYGENLQTHLDELFVMERIWLEERLELNQTNLSRKLSQKMALFKAEWRKEEMKRREYEEKRVPNGGVDDLKDILNEVKRIEARMMKKEEMLELKLLEASETVKTQNEKYKLLQEEFSLIKTEREEISAKQSEIDKEQETLREQHEKLAAEERNQLMKAMQQKDELAYQREQIALEKQKLEEIKCEREKELERQKEMEVKIQEAIKNEELAKQRATALEIEKNMEIERVKIEMEKEAIKKEIETEQEMQALRKSLAEQEIKEQKSKFTREEKDRKIEMEEERRTLEGEKMIIGEEWNSIERQRMKILEKKKDIVRERKAIGEEWCTIELAKSRLREKQTAGENKKIKEAWSSIEKEKTKLMQEQNTFEMEWNAIEKERKKLMKQQKAVEKKTEISKDFACQTTERKPKKVQKENSAKEKTKLDKRRGQDLRKVKMIEDDQMTSEKIMETEMAFVPALMEYQRRGEKKSMTEKKNKLVGDPKMEQDSDKDLFTTKKERCDFLKPHPEPGPGPFTQNKADPNQHRPKEAQVVYKPKRNYAVDLLEEFDKELNALLDSEIDTDDEKDLFKPKKEMAPPPTGNSPLPTVLLSAMTEQGSGLSIQNKAGKDQHKPKEAQVVTPNFIFKPKRTKAVDPLDEFDEELEALLDPEMENKGKKDRPKTNKETPHLPACSPLPTCKPPLPRSSLLTRVKTEPSPGLSFQKKADIKSKETKLVTQNLCFTPKRTEELDHLDELSKELDALLDSTGF